MCGMFLSSSCAVCVVSVRQFGFHHHVASISCVWVIQTTKHIQSSRDIKSNHGRQYIAELESYILVIIEI